MFRTLILFDGPCRLPAAIAPLPAPPLPAQRSVPRKAAVVVMTLVLALIAPCARSAAAESRGRDGTAAIPEACRASAAPVSLAQVFERVRRSPKAEAALADLAAFDGLVEQAGARPNPELAVEVEDFTGSGSYSAFGQTQTTASLTQRIELGGVRGQRVELAAREHAAGKARGTLELMQVELEARQRVVELIASRQRRRISAEGERLAREMLADAERRVEAGAGSQPDAERAHIAIAVASLQVAEHERDAAVAAQRLVSLWGGDAGEADCVAVALLAGTTGLPSPAPVAPVAPAAGAPAPLRPSVAVAEADIETRRAEVDVARASAAPGLEIGAGIRHLAGPDDVSAVAGLRIEVPIFDRNSGAIASAQHKLIAAQARAQAVRIETEARLERLRSALFAAAERASALGNTMIPSAERSYGLLSQAWRSGATSSLDVLEARRTLIELRLQRVDALAAWHRTLATLEAASGSVQPSLDASFPTLAPARTTTKD